MSENSIITLARLWLINKKTPYLATALWALTPIETKGLGTIGVDKYARLYWDPDVVNTWTIPEVATVLYHELNHLLRDHHARAKSREEEVFNLATDMEINDDIEEDKEWKFPGKRATSLNEAGWVTPDTINAESGKLAEYYYEKMMAGQMVMSSVRSGSGDESSGRKGPGAGDCGSCSRDSKQEGEEGPPEDDDPGIGEVEMELIRKKVAEDIQSSEGRGSVPEHLRRWAEEKLTTKINWRTVLSRYIKNAIIMASGAVDYTYLKKGRYNLPGNVIYPTLFEPVPNISIVVDTSGSMSNKHLAQALTEVEKILKATGSSKGIKVWCVDAAIASKQEITKVSDIKMKGGGGTDMRVGIAAAEKEGSDVCIVLTDGDTPWPESPPSTRVIGAIINRYHSYYGRNTPTWMKAVYCWDD